MKTLKKVVLTGAITAIALFALTVASKAATVKVTGDVINIRKSATTESEVVAMLSKDVECEYLGEEGDWYKIKYQRYTGYVSKQYTTLIGETATTTENTKTETSETTKTENNTNDEKNENQITENSSKNVETTNNTTENQTQEAKSIQYQKLTKASNVKILPLIQASTIGTLKKGAEVILIAKTGSWAYIGADDFNGWVRVDVLTEGKTVTVGNGNTTSQEKTGYINESYVNVRKGAGTSFSIIKVLTLNSEVTILGEEDGWYQIKSGSDTGYISKQFVSETKTTTSRALEEPRTATKEVETSNDEEESKTVTIVTEEITTKATTTKTETTTKETSQNNTKNTETTKTEEKTTSTSTKAEETKTETTQTTAKSETNTTTNKSETSSTTKGEEVVSYAKQFLGARYVYGGDGSNGTFDCSGFTMYVYNHFGISLPHGATSQSKVSSGTTITKQSDLKAGDIVFLSDYETGVGIGHCGIYIGDGNFIHASTTSYKVIISSLNTTYVGRFVSAKRFF